MFKSKFANALSTMMAGSLGVALAENKLAIGYGGEAGAMDDALRKFVAKHCRNAYIIARNTESQRILSEMNIRTDAGTDTAWTFNPAPDAVGQNLLKAAGWDGMKPVVAICPINPFWWPVRADLGRAISHRFTGAHDQAHYDSVYFHHSGPDVDAAQDTYLSAIADAVRQYTAQHDSFVILVGMEMLDRKAAKVLNEKLNGRCALFISDEHDMYEMVSVLYQCSLVISSRYHALVTSMPGGVPSIGITMDERIRNLMNDREQPQLALEVDDPISLNTFWNKCFTCTTTRHTFAMVSRDVSSRILSAWDTWDSCLSNTYDKSTQSSHSPTTSVAMATPGTIFLHCPNT